MPAVVAPRGPHGEAKLAHAIVMRLVEGLWDCGHFITMDNFFTNIGLFKDLLSRGVYVCGTVRANRVGLLSALKNTQAFKNMEQGTTIWRMHNSRSISYVMWKDKKLVLLLSTHATPIQALCERPLVFVPRRRGAVRENIQTSPVLQEYTRFMHGVDVVDQLHASYSCQVRSHKWWHHIFFFLLDVTVVNMYIIYLASFTNVNCRRVQEVTPMTHLQFKQGMCEALLEDWVTRTREPRDLLPAPKRPIICTPTYSKLRRRSVICNAAEPHWYCHKCGDKWMCLCKGCFERWHSDLTLQRQRNG